jgi:hypothetical protein
MGNDDALQEGMATPTGITASLSAWPTRISPEPRNHHLPMIRVLGASCVPRMEVVGHGSRKTMDRTGAQGTTYIARAARVRKAQLVPGPPGLDPAGQLVSAAATASPSPGRPAPNHPTQEPHRHPTYQPQTRATTAKEPPSLSLMARPTLRTPMCRRRPIRAHLA